MEIPALAHYERALQFRAQRNEVLSSNIANADTPNYKARDLDFGQALKSARQQSISLTTTSDLHKQAWGMTKQGAQTMYRVPTQPSLDGNTVSMDVEQAHSPRTRCSIAPASRFWTARFAPCAWRSREVTNVSV